MISIHMLKLCDKSIRKPLNIIFKFSLTLGIFPSEQKKANVVTNHTQKNKKQCVKNYRPVSLHSICNKVLERFIYNTKLTYFIESNLISENQSGFKSGDSCVNQSLAITLKIFTKLEGHSLKLSIKCGSRELCINLNETGSQETY